MRRDCAECTACASGIAIAMRNQPHAPDPQLFRRAGEPLLRTPLQGKKQQDHRRPVSGQRRADPGRGVPIGRRRRQPRQAGRKAPAQPLWRRHVRRRPTTRDCASARPTIAAARKPNTPLTLHVSRFTITSDGAKAMRYPWARAQRQIVLSSLKPLAKRCSQIGLPQELRLEWPAIRPSRFCTSTSAPRRPYSTGSGPANRPSARPACTSGFPTRRPPADPSAARPIRAASWHAEWCRNPVRPRSRARRRSATWLATCPRSCGCWWPAARSTSARGYCACRIDAPAC